MHGQPLACWCRATDVTPHARGKSLEKMKWPKKCSPHVRFQTVHGDIHPLSLLWPLIILSTRNTSYNRVIDSL